MASSYQSTSKEGSIPCKSKSLAWKLFDIAKDDQSKTILKLCKIQISRGTNRGGFTATNMLKHLNTKHPKELKEKEEKERQGQKRKRSLTVNISETKRSKIELQCSKQPTLIDTLNL